MFPTWLYLLEGWLFHWFKKLFPLHGYQRVSGEIHRKLPILFEYWEKWKCTWGFGWWEFVSFHVWFYLIPNTYNEIYMFPWTEPLLEIFGKYFWRKNYNSFLWGRIKWKKDQECLFRQSKNSSPLKYILLLIFQIHKHFSTSCWSTKQVERHLTGFSFDIIDIIKTPKIEAIFARKLQFHIKTKTNNTAFAVLYHPSHMSKGGKQYKYHIFIQKCILPWKTENKNAFKVQYVLCQHNKHEQQQLYARSGNGVGWCLFVSKEL